MSQDIAPGIGDLIETMWDAARADGFSNKISLRNLQTLANALRDHMPSPNPMWMADSRPLLAEIEKLSRERDAAQETVSAMVTQKIKMENDIEALLAAAKLTIIEAGSLEKDTYLSREALDALNLAIGEEWTEAELDQLEVLQASMEPDLAQEDDAA